MKELYKRFRPKRLSDIVGNKASVAMLTSMLKKNKLPHTILLHGPSGNGKTTIARILRRELGCGLADFQELNVSDFRGIDTIRDISRNMRLAPIGGKCRIFLLDEVHQLTKEGQNAALKILEDTPDHVYFFLATTDPNKLLPTIRTRCTEVAVSLLNEAEIKQLVLSVSEKIKVTLSDEILEDLIDVAQGSARRALVLLDKIRDLSPKNQRKALKQPIKEERQAIDLCRALIKRESWAMVSAILREIQEEPETVRHAVLGYANSVLLKTKHDQAYSIILAFENHFYDSKRAGLTRACYEALHAE